MQIDLPQDILDRVHKRATNGVSEAEIIRRALDSLDWSDQERHAIQEGINAWRAGDTRDFEAFDADFLARNGIDSP